MLGYIYVYLMIPKCRRTLFWNLLIILCIPSFSLGHVIFSKISIELQLVPKIEQDQTKVPKNYVCLILISQLCGHMNVTVLENICFHNKCKFLN